jgi:diacylglycerol kinase (ATP)
MSRHALLVINKNARQTKAALQQTIECLQECGLKYQEISVSKPNQLQEQIRRAAGDAELAIVMGGDGTLNAAVEGILETGLPLGIIPTGTANDLAHTLNVPTDIIAACRVIAEGHTQSIDLGWVNGKHFFNVASLGLTVQITRQLSKELKSRWGVLAYLFTAARVLMNARPRSVVIRAGDETHHVRTVQITVGNGRYYGGGLTVAADAAIDDGRLDLYSLEINRWWQMLPLLPAMRRGDFYSSPQVRTLHGQEFSVETVRTSRITADGELTASTPATFRVIPQAIKVFVPQPADQPAG